MQKFESHKIEDESQEYITYNGMTYVVEVCGHSAYALRVQDGYAYVEDAGNKWDLHYLYQLKGDEVTAVWFSVEEIKNAIEQGKEGVDFFAGFTIDADDDSELFVYDYNGNIYK